MSMDNVEADLETSGPVELDQLQFDLQCDTENIDVNREDESEPSALSSLIPLSDNNTGHAQHEDETQPSEKPSELNDVCDQNLFSLPDVVPEALKGNSESAPISLNEPDVSDALKGANVPISLVEPNVLGAFNGVAESVPLSLGDQDGDTLKLSDDCQKQLDEIKTQDTKFESKDAQIPFQESVQSLKDVLIKTNSVPENTRQLVLPNKEEETKDDSESEFEDEYAEQDIVEKSESDSGSEFEVPERPNKSPEPKPSITNGENKLQVEKIDEASIPSTCSSVPSIQSTIDSSAQNATSQNLPLAISQKESATTDDVSKIKVNSLIPSPKPSSGEPAATVAGVVSSFPNTNHRGQGVLKTSEDWENVTTIQAEFADKDKGEGVSAPPAVSIPLLSVSEAVQHFRQSDLSAVKPNVRTSINRHGFSALTHFLFGPPKMHRDLLPERDLVFCIAGSQLNNEERVHIQMLQSIYRILTGSRFECQRFGSHWEEIGFQGRDPGTDIRGVGMLGLVQLLYFLRNPKSAQLARDVYKLSLHPTQNFPFCVMGMNVSRICLQSLREDLINKECNRQGAVMEVVNEMYVGTYLHLYTIWKQGKTISDSGHVIKEVETFAKKNTKSVFRNLDEHKRRKPEVGMAVEEGREEFYSVCKQEEQ